VPTESIRVSGIIPATPRQVYDAWLDSGTHSRFTRGKATVEPRIGGKHTAWNGYITGETLELVPGRRIVQSWRSTDFPEDADDSRLEVLLESRAGGTEITFLHSGIPEGQGHQYEVGWLDHYLTPMRQYFGAIETALKAKSANPVAQKLASKAPAAKAKTQSKKPAPKKSAPKPAKKVAKKPAKNVAKKPAKKAPKKPPKKPAKKAKGKKR
jgi:uncharacterized protein YndB with AHSA1/START domain